MIMNAERFFFYFENLAKNIKLIVTRGKNSLLGISVTDF